MANPPKADEAPAEQPPDAPAAEAPAEEPMPTNVIAALARVMRELPGIGKDDKAAPEQGAYAYRGIESITRHAQQLLGRYGVVPILRETGYSVADIQVGGKPWTDTFLTVEYDFYGPGWPEHDDKMTVGPIHVEGRDNSDKGANKCRTQAFKYALLQTLCIGDGKDDADSGSPEADKKPSQEPPDPAREERAKFRVERLGKLTPEQRDLFRVWADEQKVPRVTGAWTDEQLEAAIEWVDRLEQEQPPPPASTPEDPAAVAAQQDQDAEQPHEPEQSKEEKPDLPFNLEELMANAAERTSANDFQWVLQAPEDLVGPVTDEVKAIPKDDLNSRLTASLLPITGNEATKRQRLAARIVRLRMERMAGISTAASAPAPDASPEAEEARERQDEPESDPDADARLPLSGEEQSTPSEG